MKIVIVRDNIIENIGTAPLEGSPPEGTTAHEFDGFVSIGWEWNDGSPVNPNSPPPPPPPIDQSNLDIWDRKLKALALVVRPATGLTLPQFKAALKSAYDSLP